MEKIKDPIGEIIRNTRKERKVSVPELSNLLSIPQDRIYKWEKGKAAPQYKDRIKLEAWIKNGTRNNIPNESPKKNIALISEGNTDAKYLALLESNDHFFKTEYAQLLISLNKLIDQGKRSEALLKLNLEHTGYVEAHQLGVEPEVIHEQINNRIVEMGPTDGMDNDAGK